MEKLFYDTMTNTYFKASEEDVLRKLRDMEIKSFDGDTIHVEDYLKALGLRVPDGFKNMGWSSTYEQTKQDALYPNLFSISTFIADDGNPVLSIMPNFKPEYIKEDK